MRKGRLLDGMARPSRRLRGSLDPERNGLSRQLSLAASIHVPIVIRRRSGRERSVSQRDVRLCMAALTDAVPRPDLAALLIVSLVVAILLHGHV